eukprot:INCI11262.1.p2 GENE.INCI11262.1~~INCI11262.1.p2  ORF type:complete len:190 (+),score=44.72 INCI11262.1:363-932(+)
MSAAATATAEPLGSSDVETIPGKPVERKLSALRDNIAAKGQYSYYYGHTKDTPEIRAEREAALRIQQAAEKNGAPVLLTKVKVERPKRAISQYSWSDGKKRVTVYIPTEIFGGLPEDQEAFLARASVEHSAKGVEFLLTDDAGQRHLFSAPKLYDEITKAVIKYAPEKQRISLVLHKKSAFTWANLQRK